MKRVHKYALPQHGVASVSVGEGARVLHVADQQFTLQMWVEEDPYAPRVTRNFAVIFTGFDQVPEPSEYIGTVLSAGGNIVSHVYEVLPQQAM